MKDIVLCPPGILAEMLTIKMDDITEQELADIASDIKKQDHQALQEQEDGRDWGLLLLYFLLLCCVIAAIAHAMKIW
jgi:hypothetical protein